MPADAAQARARLLDVLSHAVGALVMSRACPDDSPLADEILAVCRDAILQSLGLAGQTGTVAPPPAAL
jgi:TetR/AcrR family transcriptional repressor of nem operon